MTVRIADCGLRIADLFLIADRGLRIIADSTIGQIRNPS